MTPIKSYFRGYLFCDKGPGYASSPVRNIVVERVPTHLEILKQLFFRVGEPDLVNAKLTKELLREPEKVLYEVAL